MIAFANTDDLTALKNGRTFNAKLLAIERKMQSVTVAMIEGDYFKGYNDRYGHDSGDALLKQLGQAFHDFSKPGSRADVALYKAKKDGRNKVILYFPGLSALPVNGCRKDTSPPCIMLKA